MKKLSENAEPPAAGAATTLLIAYLAHLTVPVIFVMSSWRAVLADAATGSVERAVIVAGTLWIVMAVAALVICRDRPRFLARTAGLMMTIYAVYFGAGLAAAGAEVWFRGVRAAPLTYPPGSKATRNRSRLHLPGVSPLIRYSVNELGLRGPSAPSGGRIYKVIMVGGSTTECTVLDDSEEWPHQVMEIMNARQAQRLVWVQNAGVSATTAVDHLFWLKRLPILSHADLLVFLTGINDLQAALDFGGATTQRVLEYRADRLTSHAAYGSDPSEAFYKKLWLFSLTKKSLGNVYTNLRHRKVQPKGQDGPYIWASRARGGKDRSDSQVSIPDLQLGLEEYAERIRRLSAECHARVPRCVFMTQPVMWRADMPADEEKLLWMGWVGWKAQRRGWASPAELARAMHAYNETLLNVCRENHLECYDLASSIPADTSAFYDDCHFNVGGARMVAEFLAPKLLSAPPFLSGDAGDR